MITVYTKPNCAGCEYTKKFLADKGFEYTEIDIQTDPAMATHLREANQLEMPYVITDHDSWSGYRREKLKGLTK